MRWLERFKRERAARRLARRVPSALRAGWGGSEFYTPGQIARVLRDLKLDGPHARLAYAAFLTREDFQAHVGDDAAWTYDQARALFFRHIPTSAISYTHDPITNEAAAISLGPP